MTANYACDACGREGAPLLEASGQRALCLECVLGEPDLAGVDREAVQMLQFLTTVAEKADPKAD